MRDFLRRNVALQYGDSDRETEGHCEQQGGKPDRPAHLTTYDSHATPCFNRGQVVSRGAVGWSKPLECITVLHTHYTYFNIINMLSKLQVRTKRTIP